MQALTNLSKVLREFCYNLTCFSFHARDLNTTIDCYSKQNPIYLQDLPIQKSNSTAVLFSRDPPKMAHAPKTATHKKHPMNILGKEKHAHRIVSVLPKPNKAFKTAK